MDYATAAEMVKGDSLINLLIRLVTHGIIHTQKYQEQMVSIN